jgi:hypothetical protein
MNQVADCIRLTSESRAAVTLSFCPIIWWESGPQRKYINLHLAPQTITKTFNKYEDAAVHMGGHTYTETNKVRLHDLSTSNQWCKFPGQKYQNFRLFMSYELCWRADLKTFLVCRHHFRAFISETYKLGSNNPSPPLLTSRRVVRKQDARACSIFLRLSWG